MNFWCVILSEKVKSTRIVLCLFRTTFINRWNCRELPSVYIEDLLTFMWTASGLIFCFDFSYYSSFWKKDIAQNFSPPLTLNMMNSQYVHVLIVHTLEKVRCRNVISECSSASSLSILYSFFAWKLRNGSLFLHLYWFR